LSDDPEYNKVTRLREATKTLKEKAWVGLKKKLPIRKETV